MADIVSGERAGPFLLLRDDEGRRHAIRASCLLALSDAGEDGGVTAVQLSGGRTMTIRADFSDVLAWLT